jgi:hypothetical protein
VPLAGAISSDHKFIHGLRRILEKMELNIDLNFDKDKIKVPSRRGVCQGMKASGYIFCTVLNAVFVDIIKSTPNIFLYNLKWIY